MTLSPADALVLPSTALFLGATQLFHFAPSHCHWCDGPDDVGTPGSAGAGRGSLNGVDAFFHDALTGALVSRDTAGTISTVIAYGLAPAGSLAAAYFATGPNGSPEAGLRAAVIVIESVSVSGAATQALKIGFGRKRPYIRYGTGGVAGYGVDDDESRLGFVSGHTSAVASLSFSAAMCAQLQKSDAAPVLWTAATVLTLLTGTLRVMAEKHYFTDVVGGALVGAGTGVLLPLLHRRDGDGGGGVRFTGNGLSYNF